MRTTILLLALAACAGEPAPAPEPAPVEAPEPAPARPAPVVSEALEAVMPIEVDAASLAGSPILAQSFALALEALGKAAPADERMQRVAALRAKAMADVPAEDAAGLALRAAYDAALADAFEAFFTAYAQQIVDSEAPASTKSAQLQALEAALMSTGWDWDLSRRDLVQAKLMMAMRSAG